MTTSRPTLHPDTSRFAYWAARRTFRKMPRVWVKVNHDDLIQHARIAGWRAQEDYRPGQRSLHSFVTLYVERELWQLLQAAWCGKRGGRNLVVVSIDEPMSDGEEAWADTLEGDPGDYLAPLVLAEEVRQVREMLDTLPPKQREALALHYVQGLTGPEAAALLGCKLATLNLRRFDGMKRLRALARLRAEAEEAS